MRQRTGPGRDAPAGLAGRPRTRGVALLVLALLALLPACRGPLPAPAAEGEVSQAVVAGLPITIECAAADARFVPFVEQGLREGVAAARPWGRLTQPVRVVVYATPLQMRRAVKKTQYDWLVAWATERDIALVSPRALPSMLLPAYRQSLVHEMAHVIHYQTAHIPASQWRVNDPVWFREGLASVTARQDAKRLPLSRTLQMLRELPAFDPLDPSEGDLEVRQPLVYACAHHLVAFLIETRGIAQIGAFLRALASGRRFEAAFEATFGLTPADLLAQWRSRPPAAAGTP